MLHENLKLLPTQLLDGLDIVTKEVYEFLICLKGNFTDKESYLLLIAPVNDVFLDLYDRRKLHHFEKLCHRKSFMKLLHFWEVID